MPNANPNTWVVVGAIVGSILLFLSLIILPWLAIWLVGRGIERRHAARLEEREAELGGLVLTSQRRAPLDGDYQTIGLCSGNAVIAVNAIRSIMAIWRLLIGGEVSVVSEVMTQGRREAVVRLRREALKMGATHVINVRLETAAVSGGAGGDGNNRNPATMEFLAYGTAIRRVASH